MTKRIFLGIVTVLSVLASSVSCNKDTVPGGTFVSFNFSTGGIMTRAETPGDGVVATGGGIYYSGETPDLIVLIAKKSDGTIVMRYPATGQLTSHSSTTATVKFDFSAQAADDYTVYAFANTEGLWTMTTDQSNTITAADLNNPAVITNASQLEALEFKAFTSNTSPTLLNGRLPLSAKGDITVYSSKNGNIDLELLRCVAMVTSKFKNNTGSELVLTNFSNEFDPMCPDRGYVILHTSDYPASTNVGTLQYSNASVSIPDGDSLMTNWFVFPSTGPYTCDVSFTTGGRNYSYTDMRVTNSVMVDIPSISRNDNLIIETRISKGLKVSFNFEVADWTIKREGSPEEGEHVEFD